MKHMYAVILSGGRQYRVVQGQTLKLEKLSAEVGAKVNFEVLMMVDGDQIKVGSPLVQGFKVQATVIREGRHKKVHIMKFRRRKHHQKETGHRQSFTEVKIDLIKA